MGWLVHGSPRDLSFRVDKFGISISGDGEQSYTNSSVILETREIEGLPAEWTIWRASEAAELVDLFGLDARDMRRYLDRALVQVTSQPVIITRYYEVEVRKRFFLRIFA